MKRLKKLFPFKYFFAQEETPHHAHLYFEEKTMNSKNNNMSRGAQYVNRIITWAHKDNWRRKEKKK
jgi:hypothetical protein